MASAIPQEQVTFDEHMRLYCAPALMFLPSKTLEACRVGGLPQLPDHIEWPRFHCGDNITLPYHLYAQIDLGKLPRGLDVDGEHFAFPDFPDRGTLFIFAALGGWAIFEQETVVIYVPQTTDHLPHREPPEDTERLEGDNVEFLHKEAIDECRRYLKPMFYRPLPFMDTTTVIDFNHADPIPLQISPAAALRKSGIGQTLVAFRDTDDSRLADCGDDMASYSLQKTYRDYIQGSKIQPFQLFGYGDDIQRNRGLQDGRELFFQMGNGTGTPLKLPDAVIMNWIDLGELKAGDFSDTRWVQNCS